MSKENDKKKFKKLEADDDEYTDETSSTRGRGRGQISSSSSSSGKTVRTSTTGDRDGRSIISKSTGEASSVPSIPSQDRKDGRSYLMNQLIATRPEHIKSKTGESGTQVQLLANYFPLKPIKDFCFRQYRVDFRPEVELLGLRKFLIANASKQIKGYVYDGANILYLTRRLPEKETIFHVKSKDDTAYQVSLRDTNNEIRNTDATAMMVLNTILRRAMDGLKLKLIQRNLYDSDAAISLHEYKLELWPGYITSVRVHDFGILVCCETTHKVMRQETVLNIYTSLLNDGRRQGFDPQKAFEQQMLGITVLTRYNNKTYRVDEVRFDVDPTYKHDIKGVPTSLVEYYQNRYGIKIREQRQPILISNPKARDIRDGRTKPAWIVPELCCATGITDEMRSNFHLMRAMADHTRTNPTQRVKTAMEFSRRIIQTEISASRLEDNNLRLDQDLVAVTGRFLNQETIIFGNGGKCLNNDTADWTNAIRNNTMFASVALTRWGIVYAPRAERDVKEFLKIFNEVARGQRYDMGVPKEMVLSDDRIGTYTRQIDEFCAKDPKMIMIIIPKNDTHHYKPIKKITCVNYGIPTQLIVQKTLQPKKGNMAGLKSVATKILLQMNAKLGGAPWMLNIPLKGLMTIGFDVTHDSTDKSKTWGAYIASMDLKECVEYFSAVSPHRNGGELSDQMALYMNQALRTYQKRHNYLPARILFYRDGVGEGDIKHVYEVEVNKIKNVIKTIYEGAAIPGFAFVIVSKRINTRIFRGRKGNPEYSNPVPGTIVDDVITLPERYDFFLISQSVRQGTVSPTSYNVIEDTFKLKPDQLQQLTYKMCHLYWNWSGTTRVPAVVQYAHKLSILAGQFLQASPNAGLNNRLYFL